MFLGTCVEIRGSLQELVSFHCVGVRDQTQVVRHVWQILYPLSLLMVPKYPYHAIPLFEKKVDLINTVHLVYICLPCTCKPQHGMCITRIMIVSPRGVLTH